MAESFLLTFAAKESLTRVVSRVSQEFTLLWGFNGDISNLRDSLIFLEAVFQDAEQKHRANDQSNALRIWVEKLEEIAHIADDLLDDYDYELLRRKVELRNQMQKKVLNFFSGSNPVWFRIKMGHKIKKINTSMDDLKKDASAIGLVACPTALGVPSYHGGRLDRETCSDFKTDETKIIGRKRVNDDVVKALTTNSKNNQEHKLSVMAIVGMGGLGKTTVAKSVYHHDKIQKYFQEKMWVCVSSPFEVNSILRGILEFFKPEQAAVQGRDAICRSLKKELKEKRFLLVLDDVWNEDAHKWNELMDCLANVNDIQGSSILVTTRKHTVARIAETLPRCDLDKLSDDECWQILKDRAIPAGSPVIVEDEEKIGKRIAKKCGGVPLVAKVLGNIMRSKRCDGWQSMEESNIWELPGEESRILAILKLSFDELRSPSIKKCFAYCSMFVKDFEFDKNDLIQQWMAQGWLHPPPNQVDKQEMEDIGIEYFMVLLQNSFFQDLGGNSCNMHDLHHDLAEIVSKSKYSRSLFISGAVLDYKPPVYKVLRVLNLYNSDIQELPTEIGKLKHLRYLNVMKTKIKVFPKSLGQLYNLQTFKMPYAIDEFPSQIANLISLRHVCFGKYAIVPTGVLGRLTNLRSLPFLRVGKETGPKIEELGGLNHLRGTLNIFNLENVRDGEEAAKAKLVQKIHVRTLVLKWGISRPSNNVDNDEMVLELLQPHPSLEFLEIDGFMGVKLPSWLLLSNNLKEIELQGCNKCEGVPQLGRLPNLVYVKMKGMENLKCLGLEFYGYNNISDDRIVFFPALKTLHIDGASKLVDWMELPMERVKVFPCLEILTLIGCIELRSAPSHFPSLKWLYIHDMNIDNAIASILCNRLTTLTHLTVWNVKGLARLPDSLLENNQNLSELTLYHCAQLTRIAPPQSYFSSSLVRLLIVKCPKLQFLPIILDKGGLPSSLLDLIEILIFDCPELSNLPEGLQFCTSLEIMRIEKCPMITSIPIPSASLVSLSVEECPKVTSIPIESLSASTTLLDLIVSDVDYLPSLHGGFTSLRQLGIRRCQSTQLDLHKIPSSLNSLIIKDCPNLETVPSLEKFTSLRRLFIGWCHKLETVPSLEKLTSLLHLTVLDCSRLTCLLGGISPNLKFLKIGRFMEELDTFPAIQVLPQLGILDITGWSNLKSLPDQIQLLTSLKELHISSFDGVKTIPDWLGNLASLERLIIYNCKSMKYLPSVQAMQRLTKLYELSISACPLLMESCTPESGPEWHKISHIPLIKDH